MPADEKGDKMREFDISKNETAMESLGVFFLKEFDKRTRPKLSAISEAGELPKISDWLDDVHALLAEPEDCFTIRAFITYYSRLLLMADNLPELKECQADDCERYFVPSRSGSEQRFCSARCQKRVWARYQRNIDA